MTVWLLSQENFIYGSVLLILLVILFIECVGFLCKADVFGLFDQSQFGILSLKRLSPEHLSSYWYSVTGSGWLLLFLFLFSFQGLAMQYGLRQFSDIIVSEFWIFSVSSSVSVAIVTGIFLRFQWLLRRALQASFSDPAANNTQYALSGSIASIISTASNSGIGAKAVVVDNNNHEHLLHVKPLESLEQFKAGDRVVLIHKATDCWLASRCTSKRGLVNQV